MTSCFSGGGRAIRLDLDIIKSPSSSWTSNSSSPSSTLSESSNSPLVISTRKPRTPRKRPNQTYNEAAAILSTAYPKIFSAKHLSKPCKFTNQQQQQQFPFSYEPSELFLPLVQQQQQQHHHHHHQPALLGKPSQPVSRSWETVSKSQSLELGDDGDFDAESILDEEIEEGIDSIMGNSIDGDQDNTTTQSVPQITAPVPANGKQFLQVGTCYGYPVGLGFGINFDYGFGMRRAIRNPDGEDWWRFASVNVHDITPKFDKSVAVAAAAEKKKKKKKKVEKLVELKNIPDSPPPISSRCASKLSDGDSDEQPANVGLLLKLNYDNVLKDWSDGHSPFPEDSPAAAESTGSDVQARLAKIDLFTESGGLREASVQRYKEKRRTRLFSKKIRYQVRKVNADRRPRMKGRFVRRPDSPDSEQGYS